VAFRSPASHFTIDTRDTLATARLMVLLSRRSLRVVARSQCLVREEVCLCEAEQRAVLDVAVLPGAQLALQTITLELDHAGISASGRGEQAPHRPPSAC
jgi:hypothetical protein